MMVTETGFIHPTALVAPEAKLHPTVHVGPFCTVGPYVEIGEGTRLISHVVVEGRTRLGAFNTVYPFAVLGMDSPDLKFRGEPATLVVGDKNVIREYVTMHIGTAADKNTTLVGNGNLLMAGSHVAHDCVVGNGCILANYAQLAGHVELEDGVIIGGLSGIHQHVRVGMHAIIGGHSAVDHDVLPFASVSGKRAELKGLNLIGLRRKGFDRAVIGALDEALSALFEAEDESTLHDRAEHLKVSATCPEVAMVADFVLSSGRGVVGFGDE